MIHEKILFPYNFSKSDQKALDFVIRIFTPHAESTEITLFHAYTLLPKLETSKGTVMEKLTGSMGYARQRINEQEKDLKQVKSILVQSGFPLAHVKIVFHAKRKDIASEIVNLALKSGHSTIVLNHQSGRISRFFTGTVFQKVVSSLPDKTVCIVS